MDFRFFASLALALLASAMVPLPASAQQASPALVQQYGSPSPGLTLPDIGSDPLKGLALKHIPLASSSDGEITLCAQLTEQMPDIARGLVWRVFRPDPGADGKLPLVETREGGSVVLQLQPGSYLVHAAYGRAGATKRITVGRGSKREDFVLDAGGLKLDATLAGGSRVPAKLLRFSIYEGAEDPRGERALIIPDVTPNTVVRLNAGTYNVVSTYGGVNAVVRSDIQVEAGKLTEATVEHHAAEVTLKLVRDHGGEAMADTSWSVLTSSGDEVRSSVGAFSMMVLAEGDYSVIAKNHDRIYQRDFTVTSGKNEDVEVVASEGAGASTLDPDAAD